MRVCLTSCAREFRAIARARTQDLEKGEDQGAADEADAPAEHERLVLVDVELPETVDADGNDDDPNPARCRDE